MARPDFAVPEGNPFFEPPVGGGFDFIGAPDDVGVPADVELPFVEGIVPPVVGTTPADPTPGEPPIDVVPPVEVPDMDGA